MEFNQYQTEARKTRLPTADSAYVTANFVGEVGEFFGLIAKQIRDQRYDDDTFQTLLKKELGDILWHMSAIADDLGWTLNDVAQMNLDKLANRQAAGTLQGSGDER